MTIFFICMVYFLAAASPGPSQFLIIETSFTKSRHQAKWVALGVSVGTLFWVLTVVFGLKGLNQYFPEARSVLKYLSVALLFYYVLRNLKLLLNNSKPPVVHSDPNLKVGSISFLNGVLVNVLNPNSVVFFTTLFAPMFTKDLSAVTVFGSIFCVMVISIGWYQLLAEIPRFPKFYAVLLKYHNSLRILITVFYFVWALKLLVA